MASERHPPIDRELDRAGRRLGGAGWPFLIIGVVLAVVGLVLIAVGEGAVEDVGIALAGLALAPA